MPLTVNLTSRPTFLSRYLLNAMTTYAKSNYRMHATSDTERLQQGAEFLAFTLFDRLETTTEEI